VPGKPARDACACSGPHGQCDAELKTRGQPGCIIICPATPRRMRNRRSAKTRSLCIRMSPSTAPIVLPVRHDRELANMRRDLGARNCRTNWLRRVPPHTIEREHGLYQYYVVQVCPVSWLGRKSFDSASKPVPTLYSSDLAALGEDE
jgi:hypothetical protein